MQNLAGKTAIITGGASGIGLGISKALVASGMNVAIADIREDHLQKARAELGHSANVLALKLDVTDRDAYAAFADAVEARFGNIHLLVNNAGVAISGPIEQASYSDWDWVVGVNLMGAINGIVTVLPRILAHGEGGHIVNTASTSGLLPHPGAPIYVTTKSALIGLSESLRCELESKGVIVSVFCPGPVQSNIGESEKTRPSGLANTGYSDSVRLAPKPHAVARLLRGADDIGELVREGIERDLLYIFTHSEFRAGLEERSRAILSALPDTPENPEVKTVFAFTLQNQAHTAEIERHRNKN